MESTTLEEALGGLEQRADLTIRALTSALREAKKLKAAATVGQLREVRQGIEATVSLTGLAAESAHDLRHSWTFDETAHFESGDYLAELLAVGAEAGLQAYESDGRVLSYPAIVSVSSGDASVVVDKAKERRVRPSVLVRLLMSLQARPPRFRPEPFLESIEVAYDLVVAAERGRPGAIVKLADVYAVLTVMPGAGREYTKAEFARDLYLLDESGVVTTRSGRKLDLPASALTRGGGRFTTVTRSGQEKVYAGISMVGET